VAASVPSFAGKLTLMKKPKTGKRGSIAKSKGGTKTVEEYLAGIPEPARNTFDKLRATVRSVVPAKATETISYQMPAIRHNGLLVWYAAFSNHCSLFPTAAVMDEFKSELKGFTTSKGTVQFPLDKPLPVALIKKIVKTRVAQSESKKSR
jgi:uncharacterized protein YdhG (YjbR/CyaY superfamily)